MYLKFFQTYDKAYWHMIDKNQNNDNYAVVPGPADNYAVVDLHTAIDLNLGYVTARNRLQFTSNPFLQ